MWVAAEASVSDATSRASAPAGSQVGSHSGGLVGTVVDACGIETDQDQEVWTLLDIHGRRLDISLSTLCVRALVAEEYDPVAEGAGLGEPETDLRV